MKRVRKIKLAIVGPSDSVSLIEEVGQEFVDRIQLISCIYNDASEVPETIARHDADVDIWIFSGIVSYRYAIAQQTAQSPSCMCRIPGPAFIVYCSNCPGRIDPSAA